jgi:dimethylhistidine N-methyltransferase
MPEIARLAAPSCAVIEFGAGSATKTPILLREVQPKAYVPIDISGDYLRESADVVDRDFPDIAVYPVEADFTKEVQLPATIEGLPRLGFFPGSTIGNFVPQSATDLLRHFRNILGTGARLLIGMDRMKGVERLIAAYDDPEGVTAEFNLNLLRRINRELDADIPIDAFRHQARWNDMLGRIEMHLVATLDVEFTIEDKRFSFRNGQSIHTENSHKYGPRGARLLLLAGGWTPIAEWTDEDEDFALILAEAERERFAP